jgi:RHS repeat-associated protein
VYRGEFDPYGQTLLETGSTTLNSQKFTGYEKDQSTGLDYAEARMYSGSRGRFTRPDALGLRAANKLKPQSLNLYSYVKNDPVNGYDITGTFDCLPCQKEPVTEPVPSGAPGLIGDASAGIVPDAEEDMLEPPYTGGPESYRDRLKMILQNLPSKCIEAFGGPDKVTGWIQALDGIAIVASDSGHLLRPNVAGVQQTVGQYFKDKVTSDGDLYATTVYGKQTVSSGQLTSFTDSREWNTIILGPRFNTPEAIDLKAFRNSKDILQNTVLLHEFLHWETAYGHHSQINDLLKLDSKYGYTYPTDNSKNSSSVAGAVLDEFLMNGCEPKSSK